MLIIGKDLNILKRTCSIDMLIDSIEYKDSIYMADIAYYKDNYYSVIHIYSNIHKEFVCEVNLENGFSIIDKNFVDYISYSNGSIEYNACLIINDIYDILNRNGYVINSLKRLQIHSSVNQYLFVHLTKMNLEI